jgi:hypothetical protein
VLAKGLEPVVVLGPHEVAYISWMGSGAEAIAHLQENDSVTPMFRACKGTPDVVRFAGSGQVVWPSDPRLVELDALFPNRPAAWSIIGVDVDRVSDSCGCGVPLIEFGCDGRAPDGWAKGRTEQDLAGYYAWKNPASIDGLPVVPVTGATTVEML